MNAVMVFLHVWGVLIAVGGMHYVMGVLAPTAKKIGTPESAAFVAAATSKFRLFVWVSIVLLILSGLHLMMANHLLRSERAPLLLLKIALAVIVFSISLGLTLPFKAFERMQQNRLFWIRVNLLVAVVVVFLGAYLSTANWATVPSAP